MLRLPDHRNFPILVPYQYDRAPKPVNQVPHVHAMSVLDDSSKRHSACDECRESLGLSHVTEGNC